MTRNGKINPGYVYDPEENWRTKPYSSKGHPEQQIKPLPPLDKHPPEEEEIQRDEWANPLDFLFSCISMSVGFGNIWRFPFVAFENGGGAFLIPYLIILTLVGRPMYFLELIIGQFTSKGPVKCWELSPIFRGMGYASVLSTFAITSYYVSIMATAMFYLVNSFRSVLPWTECRNYTESINCQNNTDANSPVSNSELYFLHEVLNKKENVDDGIGLPEWRLTLYLFISWLLIVFTLIKGVQSSGKVAYFTALFPYVVLLILLIRGATLEGAKDGIIFFLKPKWEKLLDLNVWYQAVSQCLFSLGTGMGVINMFSSYNPFKHNIYRDAMVVSFMDTFTSLLTGITIFGILGHLAFKSGADITEVTKSGPGLTFVSYPEALGLFEWVPQLFSVLFFLMILTLGSGSSAGMASGIITIICDNFPAWPRWKVTVGICTSGFLCGLIYVTPGGQFMLSFVENYAGTGIIYIMVILEVVTIMWVYGLQNFLKDIEFMLDIKISWYWIFCWGIFTPGLLILIFLYYIFTSETLTHEGIPYPEYVHAIGWAIFAALVLLVPFVAGFNLWNMNEPELGFFQRIARLAKPSEHWGPSNLKVREEWREFKENSRTRLKIWNVFSRKDSAYKVNV